MRWSGVDVVGVAAALALSGCGGTAAHGLSIEALMRRAMADCIAHPSETAAERLELALNGEPVTSPPVEHPSFRSEDPGHPDRYVRVDRSIPLERTWRIGPDRLLIYQEELGRRLEIDQRSGVQIAVLPDEHHVSCSVSVRVDNGADELALAQALVGRPHLVTVMAGRDPVILLAAPPYTDDSLAAGFYLTATGAGLPQDGEMHQVRMLDGDPGAIAPTRELASISMTGAQLREALSHRVQFIVGRTVTTRGR